MISRKFKFSLFILSLLGLFSCTSQKNYIYLQNKSNSGSGTITLQDTFTYRIRPKDLLYIKTITPSEENSYTLTPNQVNEISGQQGAYLNGYYVNDSGYVELPLTGKIYVKDMTLEECKKAIQSRVDVYLKNTLIIVKLLNFNITVLGEVNNPGTFTVNDTKITLLEAIGLAGDLTIYGNRKEVMIVRQQNPQQIKFLDLTDKNILQSEYYHLLPNDVIYVKPTRSKYFGTNPFPFATVLSSITTLILILNFISK